MQILHQMDEHFRRLEAEKTEDDCRKRIICKLFAKPKSSIKDLNINHQKLVKLTNELRYDFLKTRFDQITLKFLTMKILWLIYE